MTRVILLPGEASAPADGCWFTTGELLDRMPEFVDEILAEHADPAACDGPHGELGMAWNAQLPDDEHIQWDAERARHLEPDGDPAARQRQHDYVVTVCVSGQPLR